MNDDFLVLGLSDFGECLYYYKQKKLGNNGELWRVKEIEFTFGYLQYICEIHLEIVILSSRDENSRLKIMVWKSEI